MKKIRFIVIPLIALLTVLATFTTGTNAEVQNDVMKPSDYEDYLLDKSKSEPESLKVLEQFRELKYDEKEAFLKVLASEDYLKILNESASLNSEEQMLRTITVDGIKVPVTIKSIESHSGLQNTEILPNATYRATASGSFELHVFNIVTSRYTTKLIWQHNGSKALQHYDTEHTHSKEPCIMVR